ncbi:hypothetical protein PPTG_13778 [Phytophthora nicotianae INRA-310]|uniref:Uncharacterized protein n=1 Tax=Phytophthora nicotianae (strain INRA-310) TaxID=761204 RepID=W2Q016_PHYN3|nr:hypothetical protein PPTG_13778 [Phytophthora nicotianae INRA-310]ETN06457.1 hypothetical protein PPTG_13778 [Phytophthora nicotianae INRA-310]
MACQTDPERDSTPENHCRFPWRPSQRREYNWICRRNSRRRWRARTTRTLQEGTRRLRYHPGWSIEWIEWIEEDDQEGQRTKETTPTPLPSGQQLRQTTPRSKI